MNVRFQTFTNYRRDIKSFIISNDEFNIKDYQVTIQDSHLYFQSMNARRHL